MTKWKDDVRGGTCWAGLVRMNSFMFMAFTRAEDDDALDFRSDCHLS